MSGRWRTRLLDSRGLLIPMATPIFFVDRERLADFTLKHRMATIFQSESGPRLGP